MSLAEVKDFIFALSAGGLLCVYPLVVLAWILLDLRAAARRQRASQIGRGGATCRRRTGKDGADGKEGIEKALAGGCLAPGWWQTGATATHRIAAWVGIAAYGVCGILKFGVCTVGLLAYSVLLSPWFIQVAYVYVTSTRLRRGIRYGPKARNYVDLYLPQGEGDSCATREGTGKAPVVVVAMGGAWIIGHRVWNAHLGLRLSQAGALVVAVDYRNFPFAQVHDMVEDLDAAVDWVFANIAKFGGDPGNVALIGQSAGAHLQALLLVERALAEARADASTAEAGAVGMAKEELHHALAEGSLCKASHMWSVRDLKGWVGVSGVYDMVSLQAHLHARGLLGFLPWLVAGGDLARHSPVLLLKNPACRMLATKAVARLPPVRLFHGEADKAVPAANSARLALTIGELGGCVTADLRPGMKHSEPVVEDPFRGGDLQAELVLPLLGAEVAQRLAALPPPQPQPPKRMVDFAEYFMPF